MPKPRSFPRHLPPVDPAARNRDPIQRDATDYVRQMERDLEGFKRLATMAISKLPERQLEFTHEELADHDGLYELVISEVHGPNYGRIIAEARALPAYPAREKRGTRFRD